MQRIMQCSVLIIAAVLVVTAGPASAAIRIPSLTRYGPPLHLNEAERFPLSVPRRTTLEAELAAARQSLSSRFEQEQALSASTETNERVGEMLEQLRFVAEEAFQETAHDLAEEVVDAASDEPLDFDEVMYNNAYDAARAAFPYAPEDAIKLAAAYVTAQADEVAQDTFEEAAYEPPYAGDSSASNDNSPLTAIAAGGGAIVVGLLLVVYFARRRSS